MRHEGLLSRRDLLRWGRVREGADHRIRVHRTAMACRFEVTLPGEDAGQLPAALDALREAERLETAWTLFRETSDLVRLNREAADAPVPVDDELFGLLEHCRHLHARTSGAFDITTTPLSRRWGFVDRQPPQASPPALDGALAAVGMDRVELDAACRTVRFRRAGMEVNLGSIAKGYAVGRIGAVLRARGVRHALVSAGGSSVLAIGGRRGDWCVDVRSRQAAGGRLVRLRLRNVALGTSGAGERFLEVEGTRYGHVLDPRTGWPAAGVLSASVVTADAATADALATAFLVGGLELAAGYCAAHPGTLALVTPADGTGRPQTFGHCDGVIVEGA